MDVEQPKPEAVDASEVVIRIRARRPRAWQFSLRQIFALTAACAALAGMATLNLGVGAGLALTFLGFLVLRLGNLSNIGLSLRQRQRSTRRDMYAIRCGLLLLGLAPGTALALNGQPAVWSLVFSGPGVLGAACGCCVMVSSETVVGEFALTIIFAAFGILAQLLTAFIYASAFPQAYDWRWPAGVYFVACIVLSGPTSQIGKGM